MCLPTTAWLPGRAERPSSAIQGGHGRLRFGFIPKTQSAGTLAVALREAREESGLDVRALDDAIFDIDVHGIPAHDNRGDGEPVSVNTEHRVRIQIASDLHLEAWRGGIPDEEAFTPVEGRDLLVLAGDIGVALGALTFIRRELARSPVLYVAGNHEHYGPTAHEEVEGAWEWIASETPDLHFLNGTPVTIDGVRFYGCTWYSGLWGVSGCAKARINGEQRIPHSAICGAGDDSERWVGI